MLKSVHTIGDTAVLDVRGARRYMRRKKGYLVCAFSQRRGRAETPGGGEAALGVAERQRAGARDGTGFEGLPADTASALPIWCRSTYCSGLHCCSKRCDRAVSLALEIGEKNFVVGGTGEHPPAEPAPTSWGKQNLA